MQLVKIVGYKRTWNCKKNKENTQTQHHFLAIHRSWSICNFDIFRLFADDLAKNSLTLRLSKRKNQNNVQANSHKKAKQTVNSFESLSMKTSSGSAPPMYSTSKLELIFCQEVYHLYRVNKDHCTKFNDKPFDYKRRCYLHHKNHFESHVKSKLR